MLSMKVNVLFMNSTYSLASLINSTSSNYYWYLSKFNSMLSLLSSKSSFDFI